MCVVWLHYPWRAASVKQGHLDGCCRKCHGVGKTMVVWILATLLPMDAGPLRARLWLQG